nr:hypothetical protein [Mycobacterium tuberculosis]
MWVQAATAMSAYEAVVRGQLRRRGCEESAASSSTPG